MPRRWMRALDGRIADLDPHGRRTFFMYAYRNTAASRTTLTLGMPLLFLIGWARDYAIDPAMAMATLPRRAVLFLLLASLAVLLVRARAYWREAALVCYACAFSWGIAMTTLAEPERISLAHVVAVLTTIIILPFALHPATAIAVIGVFCAPLFLMLAALDAQPAVYWAYLGFVLVGIGIGLGHRRVWLDTALDLFLLRGRLLSRIHADSLTGLLNREGWHASAQRAYTRSMRDGGPVALAYFDLDHFKRTNDSHGHAVGDQLLCAFADALREHSRAGELAARIGGEEFVVLLPAADEEAALAYAERIRIAVVGMSGPVPTTVSFGVAVAEPGEALDRLVARADKAMLEAKRHGRNRVLRAPPGQPAFIDGAGAALE